MPKRPDPIMPRTLKMARALVRHLEILADADEDYWDATAEQDVREVQSIGQVMYKNGKKAEELLKDIQWNVRLMSLEGAEARKGRMRDRSGMFP